jgi:PEP-CTERM motif
LRLRILAISFVLLAGSARLPASIMTFSGNFTADDDVVLIPFTIATGGSVLIQTTSFAASVGFEPVLTLYDSAGNLFLQDATGGTVPGGCGVRSIDAVSGFCLDAEIQNFLNAGDYNLALTEYDNIPGGPTLADGFPQTGNGNFTGPEFLGSPGSFILFDGEQRTSDWALSITTGDTTVPPSVPEPSTFWLIGTGLLAALFTTRRTLVPARNRKSVTYISNRR